MTEEDYSFLKEFPYTMTYSQQKTGSTTVMEAVKSVGIPIHRCYDANVKEYHLTDMPTITMVREPVGRYLAQIWENYSSGIEDEHPGDYLIGHLEHDIKLYLSWFDKHFRNITGINVYGRAFPKKQGYQIYSIRSLVILTDRLSDALEPALKEFLPPYFPDADYDNLTVEHKAKGSDRWGEDYEEFLDGVRFEKAFLEEVYSHEFCKHFFYAKDLKYYYNKWKK